MATRARAGDTARGASRGTRHGASPWRTSPRAADLLARADAELLAAQFSPEPWERFTHAHLAGLRAASAVVAERGAPTGRGAPRTAWAMLRAVAPELDVLARYFEDGAALRSAVDAGRFDQVTIERAELTLSAAEDLVDAARAVLRHDDASALAADAPTPRMLAVRAS